MNSLKGNVALVTGVGRTRGIGTAICRKLAQEGVNVFYTYWHQYDLDEYPETSDPKNLLSELRSLGVNAECQEFDLSQRGAPHKLFQQAIKQLGKPDILINNACFDRLIDFTDLTSELLDRHYEVNLRAVTLLCVEFVKSWTGASDGRIINMTSGQSLEPMRVDQIPYTTTKAGLEMLARQLAPYLAERGMTINAVDPGPTDTGWMSNELKERLKHESVVNEPVAVANAIVELLLGDANGKVIHIGR